MAVTVNASGTQTATVTTEHTLVTISTAVRVLYTVDVSAMAAADVLELRVKKPVLSGGTARTAVYVMYTDASYVDDALKICIPIVIDSVAGNASFTLKQTVGTGRAFPWSVVEF